jgi:hypothetical protein
MSTAQIIYNQSLPVNILPFIWAVGAELPVPQPAAAQPLRSVPRNMAVYRRYTEAMLRRYLRMAMEAGKVPSLLGQEMFRAKVTCYRIANFDDAVIFVADVDSCLRQLGALDREVITRLALQQFTIGETAALLGIPLRSLIRHYGTALDRLTKVFLDTRMLEPLKSCQGGSM